MSVRRLSNALLILCAVLVVWPLEPALAQQSELTLSQALERARNQAPVILAARDQIEEARGRLLGASLRFRENPTISAAAGRRNTGQTELDFSFTQPFEPGARRQARIAEAQAGVERQSSVSDNLVRRLLQEVAVAYLQAAAATQRIDVAVAADQVAGNLLIAMERRFELGDVPILDVNLARTAAARARSERRSSQAQLTEALANVRIFLGMSAEEPLSIASELPSFGQLNLANLLQEGEQRPDLRAVAAEVRQAEAEIRLGESFSRPDYGLGFSLEREEGELIAQGSVSISLPVFARGQELRATGTVRAIRLRRELEAARRAIQIGIRSAFEQYEQRVAAANEIRNVVPRLDENESLARRSFEEGEIGIVQLLQVRKDNFEMRTSYIDHLLEAAISGIEVQSRAGVLR